MNQTVPQRDVTNQAVDSLPLTTHHSTTHHPATLPPHHLVGWRLDEARAALAANAATRECEVIVVETAPPVRVPRPQKPGRKSAEAPVKRGPEVRFHDWRVLRCRLMETAEGDGVGTVELVVAREQVSVELTTPR